MIIPEMPEIAAAIRKITFLSILRIIYYTPNYLSAEISKLMFFLTWGNTFRNDGSFGFMVISALE